MTAWSTSSQVTTSCVVTLLVRCLITVTQEKTGRKRLGLSGMEELLDIWSNHMLAVSREMRQLFGGAGPYVT